MGGVPLRTCRGGGRVFKATGIQLCHAPPQTLIPPASTRTAPTAPRWKRNQPKELN